MTVEPRTRLARMAGNCWSGVQQKPMVRICVPLEDGCDRWLTVDQDYALQLLQDLAEALGMEVAA